MKKINFLFGIHNHQPVGNFEGVFKESFERCYLPFLEALEKHPGIRISLHSSGPLWDFALKNYPKYIELVSKLTAKRQIELLGGGYYEPLLSVIPEDDAVGQIGMMSDFLKKMFGAEVKGLWLTERVWEPHLPVILEKAGIKFTIIDDSHFRLAGNTDKHILNYYTTEKYGKSVAIFPISKLLRYNIPFKLPDETVKLLDEVASQGEAAVTYADDGEKFGIWPGTYKWVFEEKWLHNFFDEIEKNLSWINMPTFSEHLKNSPPVGRIYLPTASYEEMMEWALPAEAACRYKKVIKEVESQGKREEYGAFLRGGIWSNFLAKYPESNQMYKKMLFVSKRLLRLERENPSKDLLKAKAALYRGQCNCAYWHGLFGGLYLNYLRHAIYENLIDAERIMDRLEHASHKSWCNVSRENIFDQREDEIIIETKSSSIVISPALGASLVEYDYKSKAFNLSNVMSRREESYHRGLRNMMAQQAGLFGEPKSIHDIHEVKDRSIFDRLFYDSYPKFSFIEHIFPLATSLEDVRQNRQRELIDPVGSYEVVSLSSSEKKKDFTAKFSESQDIRDMGKIEISKTYSISTDAAVTVTYLVTNPGKIKALFAVELNLTLLAGQDPSRYFTFPGGSKNDNLRTLSERKNTKQISMIDEWSKFRIDLEQKSNATIWTVPLETVSQSESGFELTYQGSTIFFVNELEGNGIFEIAFKINEL